MRLPLGIAIVGVLAFGSVGCSIAPPATFYQLQQSTTETASRDNNITVLLGPLRVADYLQRENVLQREADGSLSLSQQARWAGSLQDDIGQLLLRQVSAQLGSSRIALYPDRVGIEAQAQVVLSISRLDSGVQQPAVLEAQWRLLDAKGSLRNSRVLRFEEAHNGEVADQVRAQSQLLGQLSKQLVAALQDAFPEQTVSPERKPTAAVSTKKPATEKVESINIPVVEPVREQEVYRF
ncbi:MAG: membrane integrity-associated transporter subunit PqiC [Thiopseudomonas sp.]|nr:membrane integrity-associated transporter subunit PqiC [Thiopseudomonas sp.]HHX06568.1 hypothetical protein [Pseudomonas sp.]MBP7958693.1 membrane integrity-associated transporter subunit PqiC [Thiopseudomonas sp.]MBP7996602.1 membrane integrity-associated transporter subunit PqiC [Thiopseudomonas sp.]MBP8008437.1 membrane integrity-associated transporter subunit PqiC [Thiopseudomonas sp.]